MSTINTSIPLKYITDGKRRVERIHKAGMRDPYWKERRQHQIVSDKKKQASKRKCRHNVYYSTDS